jgi:GT2 family glycosyltransferase
MNRAGLRKAVLDRPSVKRALEPVVRSRAKKRIARSGIFHQQWYEAQTGRRFGSLADAVDHYVDHGRRQGHAPHPLAWPVWISPAGWQREWPEPAILLLHPGAREYTCPLFDSARHIAAHPEAARYEFGPLAHFLSTSGPETPLPTPDGRRMLLGETVATSVALARERTVERDRGLHAPRLEWDHAAQAAVVAAADAWRPAEGAAPLVSIVMPVRNRPELVAAAVASIQKQSYGSWELLVVDDGSTDSTPDVLRALAEADPRVRPFLELRHGVSGARNIGLAAARGSYAAFLDSDNEWDPDFLRVMLARMVATGSRFAHSGIRGSRDGEVWYRGEDGGYDEIIIGNFIDLNAVMVERSLLDEVGHFDEKLRRMVDWDLAIRLAKVERPILVPFVGVLYDDTQDRHERVTTTELRSWREVILAKHLIDWPALASIERRAGAVTVVIPTFQDHEMTVAAVDAVLATAGDVPVEVVVVDNGSRLLVGQVLALAFGDRPEVTVVRRPGNDHFALGSDLGFAAGSGELVLFLNNDTIVQPGWLEPLVAALADPDVVGVQPLLLYPDRTVQCAGLVFPSPPAPPGLPSHFLIGHPAEDARRLDDIRTHAVTGAALLMRSRDVAELRGFDPLYTNGFEDVDLCLRAGGDTRRCFRVVTASTVLHLESKTPGRRLRLGANRRVFVDRWRGRLPGDDGPLWSSAGFDVAHYDVEATTTDPHTPRIARPVVVAHRDVDRSDTLRWAFKVAASVEAAEDADAATARGIATALERLGQPACVDGEEVHDRSTSYLDDVVVTVRGGAEVPVQPGRVNVLWVLDAGIGLTDDELRRYHAVLAAKAVLDDPSWPETSVTVETLERPEPDDSEAFHTAARTLLDRVLTVRRH